jgi:hypothetical protein
MASLTGDDDGAGYGVRGSSPAGTGVSGDGPNWAGVVGTSVTGSGVSAFSDSGPGVASLSNSGPGLAGQSVDGAGVLGHSDHGIGVTGASGGEHGVAGSSEATERAGVFGESRAGDGGRGVWGQAGGVGGVGVLGASADGRGVLGIADAPDAAGVFGQSELGRGVVGVSGRHSGVEGNTRDGVAVIGLVGRHENDQPGAGRGVVGAAHSATGVEGTSISGAGVWGSSQSGEGVHGETSSTRFAALAGIQLNAASSAAGVYGEHRGDGPVGYFKGDVVVTGYIQFAGADCAEHFDVSGAGPVAVPIEPGTVLVIESDETLAVSRVAYDRRVAGVVSGAGEYRPGIVLGGDEGTRTAVALIGKVYCKVDADYHPIELGDLLTTSATPGHAMKAVDPRSAFGAVIGKALRPMAAGQGLLPVLITLA